jgi:hypothetical protein
MVREILNNKTMVIKNLLPQPFPESTTREMLQKIQWRDVQPYADFRKADLCRSKKENFEIVRLFNQFINSPGICEALLFYKKECWILHIYRDAITKELKFYGCNRHIEHHSSAIDGVVKPVLHRLLHDNGGKKTLVNKHALALVGFGIMPLLQRHESGNVYQGFETTYTSNIPTHEVSLSQEQQTMARKILRLINGRN